MFHDPADIWVEANVKETDIGQLKPGMFVEVEVLLPDQDVVMIPASAISYAPYGDSVFVVKAGKLAQQFVKLGAMHGDRIAVVSQFSGVLANGS